MGLTTNYVGIVKTTGKNLMTACILANGALAAPIFKDEVLGTCIVFNRIRSWDLSYKISNCNIETIVEKAKTLNIDMSFLTNNEGYVIQFNCFQDAPYDHELAKLYEDIIAICGGGELTVSTEYDLPNDMCEEDTLIGETYVMPKNPTNEELDGYSKFAKQLGIKECPNLIMECVLAQARVFSDDSRDEMGFIENGFKDDYCTTQRLYNAWVGISKWYNNVMGNSIYKRAFKMDIKMNLFNFVAFCIHEKGLDPTEVSLDAIRLAQDYVNYLRENGKDVNAMLKGLANVSKITFESFYLNAA